MQAAHPGFLLHTDSLLWDQALLSQVLIIRMGRECGGQREGQDYPLIPYKHVPAERQRPHRKLEEGRPVVAEFGAKTEEGQLPEFEFDSK